MRYLGIMLFAFTLLSCQKESGHIPPPDQSMYFPSNTDTAWQRISPAALGWNANAMQSLKTFLNEKHSRSFMILVNGRIAMEEYFNGHGPNDTWQWNSAGKTLTSAMTGIAAQQRLLNIDDKVSKYLGAGWTSEPAEKESLITIRHLLTMTTGINDESEFVIKPNLTYMADAGTRWAYSNVFQKLIDVVAQAGNTDFESYFESGLKNKIGMEGFWNFGTIYKIYHSNTRSMARFGLLALNQGKWNNNQIINADFFKSATNTSQNINPSYGYFWWLNGKDHYMLPGTQSVFQGDIIPAAPTDMVAAMGKGDQRIYIVPGRNLVIVRMGDPSDPENPSFAVSGFDNALWEKINAVIN